MSKAYVITRKLDGGAHAVVCDPAGTDRALPIVGADVESFDARYDGELTAGALALALSILADWLGEAESYSRTHAALTSRHSVAQQHARAFAFDHFTTTTPLPLTLSGEHIDRWLRAHAPVAA